MRILTHIDTPGGGQSNLARDVDCTLPPLQPSAGVEGKDKAVGSLPFPYHPE